MVLYNLRLALLSLRRNRVLSALIVGGIALGIAVSTMFSTMRHAFAQDPLPGRSDRLFYVRMDSWDPLKPYPGDDPTRPPTQITYQDAMNILRSDIPARQTAMYRSNLYLHPDPSVGRPRKVMTRLCFSDFFPMFDVPFKYGSGWDKKADQGPEQVVVLDEEINDLLFGGQDSVGKTVRVEDREFKVVGVLAHWQPTVKFYDVTTSFMQAPEGLYIPFGLGVAMEIRTSGNTDGWKSPPAPGIAGFLASETSWIQFWAELPEDRVQPYKDFIDAYVIEQKKTGRFPRPLNNRVTPMMAWLKEQKTVPEEVTTMMIVSLLFLAVCSLNLTGLLLSKFLARAPEIGVRRALGARRLDIFLQHLVECEMVAIVGGTIGVVLSLGGLAIVNKWGQTLAQRADLFRLDATMLAWAVGLSLLAGLLAGVYPAWRVCRTAPAMHLKLQ
jgi:putative ABC transport system permease protein